LEDENAVVLKYVLRNFIYVCEIIKIYVFGHTSENASSHQPKHATTLLKDAPEKIKPTAFVGVLSCSLVSSDSQRQKKSCVRKEEIGNCVGGSVYFQLWTGLG
jgi:hypothetical protein